MPIYFWRALQDAPIDPIHKPTSRPRPDPNSIRLAKGGIGNTPTNPNIPKTIIVIAEPTTIVAIQLLAPNPIATGATSLYISPQFEMKLIKIVHIN